jgi:hypothetical protein
MFGNVRGKVCALSVCTNTWSGVCSKADVQRGLVCVVTMIYNVVGCV